MLDRSKIPWCLSFLGFFMFSSGGHLVQQSRTVRAILVEDNPRNILVKLLKNLSSSIRGHCNFKAKVAMYVCLLLWKISLSYGV